MAERGYEHRLTVRLKQKHSMSNGATCKHTGLVVSHKLDVRMHVSDEYGVVYAKRFGRLPGMKV